jgi:1,4-alpha-glucan branching enzyme
MADFQEMGAVLDKAGGQCGFRVWAPHARSVFVTGDFCGWRQDQYPLSSEGASGNWATVIPGVPAGAQYKYVFDGAVPWKVDAYARQVKYVGPCNRNGVVLDRAVAYWSPFATPRYEDLILYQLHIGSFAGRNDGIRTHAIGTPAIGTRGWVATCEQILCKLDYIRGLGFNALALLPVHEYPRRPGQAHMGYAPELWFAPESDLGGPDGVRRLVDKAHECGLAVIFDVVYSHASVDHNYYWNYDGYGNDGGIYFEGGGESGFGHIPAHQTPQVQDFFLDNARMWLEDYRGDGLRFDAAHCIKWESLRHIVHGLRQNPYWRDKFMVAEWSGDRRDQWQAAREDIGFDAMWGMAGPYGFREAVKRGAFGGDAVEAMLSVMELAPYARSSNIVRYYLGSHDQIRDEQSGGEDDHRYPVEKFGGRGSFVARAQCRMGWALNVTVPGVPMMFMGCEGHMPGYWWPTLDANPVDQEHRIDWLRIGDDTGAPMQRLVREANQLRWDHPALRSYSLDVPHQDHANNVLAFRRWNDAGDVILVVANFSDRHWPEYALRTGPGGWWQEIFNSQAPCYGGYEDSGNGPGARGCDGAGWLHARIPAWSVLAFRKAD